jgi:ketosteroid isomerase-like protein
VSQENVEIVRRAFAELAGESPQTVIEEILRAGLAAPDAEFDFSAMYPDGPILRGPEAWRRFIDGSPWGSSLRGEPERFFDVDNERVLVLVRLTAEGEESGTPVEIKNAYEFTIRDGVFVRWKVYADRAEALEAAGLSAKGGGGSAR